MRSEYLVLSAFWAAYCAIHSALISTSATRLFKRMLGTRYCFYRLFFNSFSLITLIALMIFSNSHRFHGPVLLTWTGNWRMVRYSLILLSALLVLLSARHYSMSQFLGIQQIRQNQNPSAITASGEIETTGILGIVRHPWYVAVFILIWSSDQNLGTIVINAILSAYLVIGTLLEEKKLVMEFGDKYREYQRSVSMFIPLKWLNLKIRRQAT